MTDGSDWVEQARRLVSGLGHTLGESLRSPGADAQHGSDCRWCPLCQAAAVLRGERPEITAALADALSSAATALRAYAESPAPAAQAQPGTAEEPGPDTAGEPEPPGGGPSAVQRIEIA
ncbi:hypothetical protein [Geodermatophilus ruber]|uniref:Uncharacterized protein n=1 Tax=Geodermatophilus ruber TaxID=504800 RepID=A0A1I4AW43_9ACTN|nr:hypothetical protein [Geodermatophilus ruber]SFK59909.1 hypothetical protein SAMN04488085_102399 [Geodermatophilus ruber]